MNEASPYVPVSIPVDLEAAANEFVHLLETEPTSRKWCQCEWIIHPDDVNKPEGNRRLRRGEPSLICTTHTKEGFLISFVKWLAK